MGPTGRASRYVLPPVLGQSDGRRAGPGGQQSFRPGLGLVGHQRGRRPHPRRSRAQAALPCIPPASTARQAKYYEDRPFREQILQDHSAGAIRALITRNSFGCEVLNTDVVGFADIDYEAPRIGVLASLFGAKKKLADLAAKWEAETLDQLRNWQRANAAWSFRVYRTAGGLRLLRTSGPLAAESAEADAWLQAVGSDPLYRRLCKNQKSFRARLTPKPWRCGLKQLRVYFPWTEPGDKATLDAWLESYQAKCAGYAVCDLIETVGNPYPARELEALVALHDERTSVGSGKPLA